MIMSLKVLAVVSTDRGEASVGVPLVAGCEAGREDDPGHLGHHRHVRVGAAGRQRAQLLGAGVQRRELHCRQPCY